MNPRNNTSRIALRIVALGLVTVLPSACTSSGAAGPMQEEHIINHQVSPEEMAAAKSTQPIAAQSVLLWVNGMGCPLCASNIDRQLERVKGVTTVNVDLGNGTVALGLSPSGPHPSPARLGDAVEDAGFTLVKVVPQ